MSLENRIILVTGAGSGLGRAVACACATAGARVFLLGSRLKALKATDDLIRSAGGEAGIVPLNLESELQRVPEVAKALFERFGRLDALVNAAALVGPRTPLDLHCPADWESVFRVNVAAPFFLTREMMPLLKRSDSGVVIQVVCREGMEAAPFRGAYGASKAALWQMTRTWAAESPQGPVRMSAVDPGPMATALRAKVFPGEDPATLPTPESVTGIFVQLASGSFKGGHGELFQGGKD
ncbi:MAG: SDR family NAD(P)-dependent oxidoreductase [Magnetococcales bacterium]|nr:SDR family NAD(P)-dependent oxidoreductase [Magnetococcales bacterium]